MGCVLGQIRLFVLPHDPSVDWLDRTLWTPWHASLWLWGEAEVDSEEAKQQKEAHGECNVGDDTEHVDPYPVAACQWLLALLGQGIAADRLWRRFG